MKRKSEGKRRPSVTATTTTTPSFSAIPHLSDQHNPLPEPVDLFDKSICICCGNNNGSDERVLLCHVTDCPLAVHATCLRSQPRFDDSGNFYCPYCWYKRALDTCHHLRDKVILAKKALSGFLDNKARARQNQKPEEEHVERTESQQNKDKTESEGNGECMEKGESEENKDELAKEEGVEDTKPDSEENKDEGKGFVSVTGSSVSEAESEGVSVKKRKDQKEVASARRKKPLLAEEHNKQCSNRGKVASGGDEEEVTSSRRQQQRSPAKGKKQTLLNPKRRRLFWTAEETKALKEGVLKFSAENQNIPWRKILEFGCHVFDKTRNPVDLKDKWKNICKYG